MGRFSVYAVRRGYKTGIFMNWPDCKAAVDGYQHAEFKGFNSVKEAVFWLNESKEMTTYTTDTAIAEIAMAKTKSSKRILMQRYFDEFVASRISCWPSVMITPDEYQTAIDFVKKKNKAKMNELAYQKDGENMHVRSMTGVLAEFAVAKVLGLDRSSIDIRVGNSLDFNTYDIPEIYAGVKAAEWGKVPLVPRWRTHPQVICIVQHTEGGKKVYICGVADPQILKKYQSDALVLDDNCAARNVKAGFYGYEHLQNIHEYAAQYLNGKENNHKTTNHTVVADDLPFYVDEISV